VERSDTHRFDAVGSSLRSLTHPTGPGDNPICLRYYSARVLLSRDFLMTQSANFLQPSDGIFVTKTME
jgi:hypothetical protein